MDSVLDRSLLRSYATKSSFIATRQVVVTLLAYALLWCAYLTTIHYSPWLVVPYSVLGGLLVLRMFVLMHDCGHGSLFPSKTANGAVGYLLGLFTGMPQYVWSQNHAYHHATNGDWELYRGPLAILSTAEYEKLDSSQQRNYWLARHTGLLLPGGFFYLGFNPRYTWLVGSVGFGGRLLASLFQPSVSTGELFNECKSRYWKTPKEYLHMSFNNVALLTVWVIMCSIFGAFEFFAMYGLCLAIGGGLGIMLFSVQHYFEESYAQDTANNDRNHAALEGTSYLVLPAVLNWFTADIAYHHVHHLSSAIPNYNLARCHRDLQAEFTGVKRISLGEIREALTYLLWDTEQSVLVSLREHLAQQERLKAAG